MRERFAREPESEWLQYFVRLATFHEDMHAEAFHYTRQTLGYPDPFAAPPAAVAPAPRGDAEYEGGRFRLGAELDEAFAVREALAGLSEDCREVLDRFFCRDESYRTIGEALGLPSGTIASRISRCLGKLRESLEGSSESE